VGYGDLVFKTTAGRIFAIFWIIIGTISLARMLSAVIDARAAEVARIWNEKRNKRLLMKRTDLSVFTRDGQGQITRLDFLKYKLVTLGRCEQWMIDDILSQFDMLDEDGSGTLEVDDFKRAEKRERDQLRARIQSLQGVITPIPVSENQNSVSLFPIGTPQSDADEEKVLQYG